jgi:hypothetical protein
MAVGVAVPATAHAATLDVTCIPPSADTATYNPPLSNTPRTTTITVDAFYGPCVSLSNPAVSSGEFHLRFTAPNRSCAELLGTAPVTFTITWNTGQTSTVVGTRTVTTAGGLLQTVLLATVTTGLFAGDTVVQTSTSAAAPVLLCTLGLGTVSTNTQSIVLEITSV